MTGDGVRLVSALEPRYKLIMSLCKACAMVHKFVQYGPRREKTCLRGFENNTGEDQPAHPRSLISAFVICFLQRIISQHAASEISIFYLVSVAEQTGLCLALSDTPKTGYVATRPICTL